MKEIIAHTASTREIFTKKYIIPNFQRPYSWDPEQCEKLWVDITDFCSDEDRKDENYFLGNIVTHPTSAEEPDVLEVIDGQQRLTTLLLLIKVIHAKTKVWFDVSALEECLQIRDPNTGQLTPHVRVESRVMIEDKENLHTIILEGLNKTPKSKFTENYKILNILLEEWCSSIDDGKLSTMLQELIHVLLNDVVFISIQCDSQNDALSIFETINNRGLPLSDADIFKAKLYHATPEDKQQAFNDDWNALKDHDWLFRVLMHVLRAKSGDTSNELNIRSFFSAPENHLDASERIMNSLKIINKIGQEDWSGSDETACLWHIMDTYPNDYWKYPLYVFLHKYGSIDQQTDDFLMAGKVMAQFRELLEATVKYFFIKGIIYNRVYSVKNTVYRVCAKIESGEDYISEYSSDITQKDRDNIYTKIHKNQAPRYLVGLVLLSAYLNPLQNKAHFKEFMSTKYHIEHILPKKWNNYDGWNENTWKVHLNTLGNCIPLQSSLNIAAKNEFFDKKKTKYQESTIQDALDLVQIAEWTPTAMREKQADKEKRLMTFLKSL